MSFLFERGVLVKRAFQFEVAGCNNDRILTAVLRGATPIGLIGFSRSITV